MTFQQSISRIPLPTGTGAGTGLTVPILKAFNHATVALTHDASCGTIERETLNAEITAIAGHLDVNALLMPTWASQPLQDAVVNLRQASLEMLREYAAWSDTDLRNNLTALTARIPSVLAIIDQDLAGFTDAGVVSTGGQEL